jgi:hypothetical protein
MAMPDLHPSGSIVPVVLALCGTLAGSAVAAKHLGLDAKGIANGRIFNPLHPNFPS